LRPFAKFNLPLRQRRNLCGGYARCGLRRRCGGPEPEQTALAHAIPTGPVVVMPEALKRERAARQAAPPAAEAKVPELNAESLTRDLAARWLSGAKPLSA
jgi:hypothetical protein